MTKWMIMFVLATMAMIASAQKAPPPNSGSVNGAGPIAAPQFNSSSASATPALGQGAKQDTAALANSLAIIESGFARVEGKLPAVWWMTPLTTLLSVVIGGLITGWIGHLMQARLLAHQDRQAAKRASLEENLAKKKADHELRQTEFDWHLRQFMELYGPLRALFDGSNEVYRRMNEALISHDGGRFRDLTLLGDSRGPTDVDPDGRLFEIYDEEIGDWRKFRTIMDWSKVYGQGLGVDGYFDRIVDIGGSISKLIGEKAGLVMPHHGELLAAFGKYLAHFEVLKELHAGSQLPAGVANDTIRTPLKVREAAAFPNSIQRLVRSGADELLAELAGMPGAKPVS